MKHYLNTQSIFFKLNILFALAIVILIISGFSTFNFFLKGHQKNMALKYIYIEKTGINNEILDILNLVKVSNKQKENVLRNAIKPPRRIANKMQFKNLELYANDGYIYIYSKDKHYMLRSKNYFIKDFLSLGLCCFWLLF